MEGDDIVTTTRKARPGTAIPGRAVESGRVCETVQPSTHDSTTSPAERQPPRISDLLLHGEQNAMPMKCLKGLTGLDSRTIRLMIQQERLSGTPICANNKTGYYLPGSDLERAECVKSMRHRSAEIARTAAAIEQGGDGA